MATESGQAKALVNQQPESLWAAALHQLKKWHPAWPEHTVKMTTNPWMNGMLPIKLVELVSSNASRTNLKPEGTRRRIRATLAAGASRQEILFVLKCASVMSIHSFGLNAPLRIQEASLGSLEDFSDLRKKRLERIGKASPAVEKMKAIGHWSEEWDSSLFFDPVWSELNLATCTSLYAQKVSSSQRTGTSARRFRRRSRTHLWPGHAAPHQERLQGRCNRGRNHESSKARCGAGSAGLQSWCHASD